MTHCVLLNNIDHKDLRVITARSKALGDNVMTALTFAQEFRNIQAHYPIVFYKSEDGVSFHAAALLGFQEGENLFLNQQGWDAAYIPLSIQREPFMIGWDKNEMVMHIDMDSPRISTTDGEAIFLPFGGATDYLESMNSALLALHQGIEDAAGFSAALLEHHLLESFVFDVELSDSSQSRLAGFYTINEERLNSLDGSTLERLHRAGYLQPIYMVIASMSNLHLLAHRKNRVHATPA